MGAAVADTMQGPGWWQATNGKWYAPETHPEYKVPTLPPPEEVDYFSPAKDTGPLPSSSALPPSFDFGSPPVGSSSMAGRVPYSVSNFGNSGRSSTRRRIFLGLGFAIIALGGVLLYYNNQSTEVFDSSSIESTISNNLSQTAGTSVTVTCPSNQPVKTNFIFDCTATDTTGSLIVRVTENDNQGHVTWELTDQTASGPGGQTG
jgi:hypothetical protein